MAQVEKIPFTGWIEALERRIRVLKMRQSGMTYDEIGGELGVTKQRARQICMGNDAQPARHRTDKPARPDAPGLLMVNDVSRLLRIHPNTVRRWSNRGVLKVYRVGPKGHRRFRREDVESILGGRTGQ